MKCIALLLLVALAVATASKKGAESRLERLRRVSSDGKVILMEEEEEVGAKWRVKTIKKGFGSLTDGSEADSEYKPNQKRKWYIRPPKTNDDGVTLKITRLDLEEDYDTLRIYSLKSKESLCEDHDCQLGEELWDRHGFVVRFRSDQDTQGTGFELVWVSAAVADQIPSDDENDAAAGIDLDVAANVRNHRTQDYKSGDVLVVRRGAGTNIIFRGGEPSSIVLRYLGCEHANKKWGAEGGKQGEWELKKIKKGTYELSSSLEVGIGDYVIEATVGGRKTKAKIFVILNPYNPASKVYMGSSSDLREYVERSKGAVWQGDSASYAPTAWDFAQYNEESIVTVRHMLRKLTCKHRGDVFQIARFISWWGNSENGAGILQGNWGTKPNSFNGGVKPWKWTGNDEILKVWVRKNKAKTPVKFGQCWVFSGLVVGLARAIGMPARSVTNCNSAHETGNYNHRIASFWDTDRIGDWVANEDQTGEMIWNFHVWNEVWLLVSGKYKGWHAIDATPQELSDKKYQCGPAPVKAIRKKDFKAGKDTKFVSAEVDADEIVFERSYKNRKKKNAWEYLYTDTMSVGDETVTSAKGQPLDPVSLKKSYKIEKGEELVYEKPAPKPSDFAFRELPVYNNPDFPRWMELTAQSGITAESELDAAKGRKQKGKKGKKKGKQAPKQSKKKKPQKGKKSGKGSKGTDKSNGKGKSQGKVFPVKFRPNWHPEGDPKKHAMRMGEDWRAILDLKSTDQKDHEIEVSIAIRPSQYTGADIGDDRMAIRLKKKRASSQGKGKGKGKAKSTQKKKPNQKKSQKKKSKFLEMAESVTRPKGKKRKRRRGSIRGRRRARRKKRMEQRKKKNGKKDTQGKKQGKKQDKKQGKKQDKKQGKKKDEAKKGSGQTISSNGKDFIIVKEKFKLTAAKSSHSVVMKVLATKYAKYCKHGGYFALTYSAKVDGKIFVTRKGITMLPPKVDVKTSKKKFQVGKSVDVTVVMKNTLPIDLPGPHKLTGKVVGCSAQKTVVVKDTVKKGGDLKATIKGVKGCTSVVNSMVHVTIMSKAISRAQGVSPIMLVAKPVQKTKVVKSQRKKRPAGGKKPKKVDPKKRKPSVADIRASRVVKRAVGKAKIEPVTRATSEKNLKKPKPLLRVNGPETVKAAMESQAPLKVIVKKAEEKKGKPVTEVVKKPRKKGQGGQINPQQKAQA